MNNAGFYIFAIVAVVLAAFVLRKVVTCLMRSVVIVVLLVALAVAYYLFVGQYDAEVQQHLNDLGIKSFKVGR